MFVCAIIQKFELVNICKLLFVVCAQPFGKLVLRCLHSRGFMMYYIHLFAECRAAAFDVPRQPACPGILGLLVSHPSVSPRIRHHSFISATIALRSAAVCPYDVQGREPVSSAPVKVCPISHPMIAAPSLRTRLQRAQRPSCRHLPPACVLLRRMSFTQSVRCLLYLACYRHRLLLLIISGHSCARGRVLLEDRRGMP